MSKKLEEYIREHRKSFDADGPSDQLWSRIVNELDREKLKKPWRVPLWLGIAASLTVILTAIFIYTYRDQQHKPALAGLNPTLARKEMQFASLIEEKKDSLQIYAKANPKLYRQFSADLDQLSADYDQLKNELKTSPNPRAVAGAMVKNLKLQLQVITQQLMIINEVNEYSNTNKENSI
ncbi:hypothetical protein [Pedobacter sp. JY14-1]|uniref:hypothetical protein n=1 Tax=Pedobacter sp. JY14-1 TaxID=3034151 RepID=UPI0023E1455A|nr:hypothetical protein [Pedobacter sp. JY14-1]